MERYWVNFFMLLELSLKRKAFLMGFGLLSIMVLVPVNRFIIFTCMS
ncbi:hypothetical protein Golob_007369 [Gossypium lobatum]|uniref:Uncharacterized protein n=1 Tax=Gossypium lobatum TaxID=34289 RepID=A0A7J8MC91_9ROSI|nr:hypothetical protein [Gossypium lobatum]